MTYLVQILPTLFFFGWSQLLLHWRDTNTEPLGNDLDSLIRISQSKIKLGVTESYSLILVIRTAGPRSTCFGSISLAGNTVHFSTSVATSDNTTVKPQISMGLFSL